MENTIEKPTVEYCLYARKSSEDDERQAMSIDSQIKEMSDMAIKEGLFIKEVRKESYSAKLSGKRPVFNQLLQDIEDGMFTGVLTWAPDRLSRNAGDLGIVVDLMDKEKLTNIKTYSQAFTNTPSEKFLLMILCSQAKLENDQKGINVKRGIRAKCKMGWRPGLPPIGYYNRAFNGVKDIVPDPERAPFITEMFQRVASKGDSGRKIKEWFDSSGVTTRAGKKITLSQIYRMLKSPFYYGEFEYPAESGNWYKGAHKSLISKALFDKVQKQLVCPPRQWGVKEFAFKDLFKCGSCGSNIIGEERWRKRKSRPSVHHVYYHCTRQKDWNCKEPYISEDKLVKELLRFIQFTTMAHPQTIKYTPELNRYIGEYKKSRDISLLQQDIDPDHIKFGLYEYAQYALKEGTSLEKKESVKSLCRNFFIKNKTILSNYTYV